MPPKKRQGKANISDANATTSSSARIGRLDDNSSPTSAAYQNITEEDEPHGSMETSLQALSGELVGTGHLSPGFDQTNTEIVIRDPSTGAMSMEASTHGSGHAHGALCQRDTFSHRRLSLFSDRYLHARDNIFFPTISTDSSVAIFNALSVGVNTDYNQDLPEESSFTHLGVFTTPEYMSSSPDRGTYSPSEKYGKSYEDSDDTRSRMSAVLQQQPQQPASPLALFDPITAPDSDITRGSQNYPIDYGSVQPPHPQSADDYVLPPNTRWFGDVGPSQSYYGGNPSSYQHAIGSHGSTLGSRSTSHHGVDDAIQSSFSEAYRGLDSSILVDPKVSVGETDRRFAANDAIYVSPDRRFNEEFIPATDTGISTLDPRLHSQPPKPSRKSLRNNKAKFKVVRRNSRQEPTEKSQSQQRPLQRQGSQRIAFESKPEDGVIPGCYVLTPTVLDHPGDDMPLDYIGPLQDGRRIAREKAKRKPMPEEERAAVKLNRLQGVCFRCKVYKEKCRGGFPCDRCLSIPLFWFPICVTTQFVEKRVFGRGLYQALHTQAQNNVREWLAEPSTVYLSNGLDTPLQLQVHEYVAHDTTLLTPSVWRGNTRSGFMHIDSTQFGISPDNDLILMPTLDQYLDDILPHLVTWLCRSSPDMIFISTMNAATAYSNKNTEVGALITSALRIWTAQFLSFRYPWRIDLRSESANSLGMPLITSQETGLTDFTPLPHLLNQQLDGIFEKKVAELELSFLTELQSRIFRRPPEDWFGIFFALYCYFSSLEQDTRNLEYWNAAIKAGETSATSPTINWPLDVSPEALVEKNQHLVDVLAAHFRGFSRGLSPFFPEENKVDVQEMAVKEDVDVAYITTMKEQVKDRADSLKEHRLSKFVYENPHSLDMKYSSRLMVEYTQDER